VAELGRPSPIRLAAEALLRPFAQIVFSRDLRTGFLILLAIAVFPWLGLATVGAVVLAQALSWLLGFGTHAIRQGGHATSAVLTTLALGVFAPGGGEPWALLLLGAVLAVLLSASFQAVFSAVALPAHSLPFIAAAWTMHLASRVLPASQAPSVLAQPWAFLPPGLLETTWLDVPASLLFLHGALSGMLVVAAIALYSRIALLLAFVGGAAAFAMRAWLRAEGPWSEVDLYASFNAVLTAMAVGGVWFVPQPSSVLLAGGMAALTAVIAYALFPVAGLVGLPILSLPFIVATHLTLTATRIRERNRRPRATLPAERPEEALASHLMRLRRFGDVAWLPFRLPFRGEWVVTQGHDGRHTHKGPWRHGLDFEARGPDGQPFARDGRELKDYYCYGLPVLAAGAGTVALVVDKVPDNRPGDINTQVPWGNAVVIAHGLALYSVYAHLQPQSIRVKPGEQVAAGAEIARCGNSGRSAVPHLHFQVQRAQALGSPTVEVDFGDVVTRDGDSFRLSTRVVPAEGALVRPVVRDEGLARALSFLPGETWLFQEEGTRRREKARVEVDLWGRRLLRTEQACLFLDPYETGLVLVEFEGKPGSLLGDLLLALARIPFDQAPSLSWQDDLPRRLLLPPWLRVPADLLAIVAPGAGDVQVAYSLERLEGQILVRGRAAGWQTRALISLGANVHRLEIAHGALRRAVELRRLGPGVEEES
jgi:urea transporter